MSIFTVGRRVFAQVANTLGILESGGMTKWDNEPAKTIVDARLSIQAAAELRRFVLSTTVGAGGVTTDTSMDFRVAAGWTEIFFRGAQNVLSPVPDEHEFWITSAGVSMTVAASFTSVAMFRRQALTAEFASEALYMGDTEVGDLIVTRGARLAPPQLQPFPWYFPLAAIDASFIFHRANTANAGVITTSFTVLSAPPGTFERIY